MDVTTEQPIQQPIRLWRSTIWWLATVATLVVLDDLAFGPAFWIISRQFGPGVAVFAVYAIYVPAQIFIVSRGMSEQPGRFAGFFLKRLSLDRRFSQMNEIEHSMKRRIIGASSALLGSLVLGGVIPPLVMWRKGHSETLVRRLSVATAAIYATEFAVLHGIIPSLF